MLCGIMALYLLLLGRCKVADIRIKDNEGAQPVRETVMSLLCVAVDDDVWVLRKGPAILEEFHSTPAACSVRGVGAWVDESVATIVGRRGAVPASVRDELGITVGEALADQVGMVAEQKAKGTLAKRARFAAGVADDGSGSSSGGGSGSSDGADNGGD